MKKNSISILLLFAIILAACSLNKPVISEQFLAVSSTHKKIAVIPFAVSFNEQYKQMMANRSNKARTDTYWDDLSRFAGLDMQKEFFKGVAKQISKGKYSFILQDFLTTNKILESNKVPFMAIQVANKQKIGELLEVDAVIWGETEVTVNPMSFTPGGVETNLYLYDVRTGQSVWEYNTKQYPNSPRDTPESLANNTASQLAKMLPYTVK